MKKLLFITFILLTFFKVKAQQDSIPFLLPDYITETDTFHVYHHEANHKFKGHIDIALTPFYILNNGTPFAAVSMTICTMTHRPYFFLLKPLEDCAREYIMLIFADTDGRIQGVFEIDHRREHPDMTYSICYSTSLRDLLLEPGDVMLFFPLVDNNMTFSKMKECLCTPNIQYGLYMLEWNYRSQTGNISLVGTAYKNISDILCSSVQIYEDYIRLNNIDIPFTRE